MDRRKEWRAAEKLLKQGNVDAALRELHKVADGSVADVVTLNRLGDLFARQGRPDEAIGYYTKIALQFEKGDLVPKAIAIYKKILRLDAERLDAALRLGELYFGQRMAGEARRYLMHAATRFLDRGQAGKAREVFERLTAAEPDEIRHRVRLAETLAAEGDLDRAVTEFGRVGDRLLASGSVAEAEQVFQRAHEIDTDAALPLVGLARCQEASGAGDAAIESLETLVACTQAPADAVGELARLYAAEGRTRDALRILHDAPVLEISRDTWFRLLRTATNDGALEEMWQRLDRELARGPEPALIDLLTHLVGVDPDGHIPALERLASFHEAMSDAPAITRTLNALEGAYRAASREADAAAVAERLRRIAPAAAPPAEAVPAAPESFVEPTSLVEAAPSATSPAVQPELPIEIEAPAVPLNRTDEEFVAGRVTQCEVLEKYELLPQALEQLQEVVGRFPGHVGAQQRRVEVLRGIEGHEGRAQALVDLAVALRAAGDLPAARRAAEEAATLPQLVPKSRALLVRLGLFDAREEGRDRGPVPRLQVKRPANSPTKPVDPPEAQTVASDGDLDDDLDIVIDLDDDRVEVPQKSAPAPKMSGPPEPPAERVASIRRTLAAGDTASARIELDGLCEAGYAGRSMGELRQELEQASAPPDAASLLGEPEDDDLSAIRAALEIDLLENEELPIVPEESVDQSIDEILRTFQQRVDEQVDDDDHRMHYELGIGYKEMGLIEEAIDAFLKATRDPGLGREACAMLATCHRESQRKDEAVKWYRAALEKDGSAGEVACGVRYDLAETLIESGDLTEALQEFRDVLQADPGFRDVAGRISDLESRLQS